MPEFVWEIRWKNADGKFVKIVAKDTEKDEIINNPDNEIISCDLIINPIEERLRKGFVYGC